MSDLAFEFHLVTPERRLVSERVRKITCVTELGQVTVLPHHAPLVATLVPGEVHVVPETGQPRFVHVAGGFLQIRPGGSVTILADAAEHHEELDEARALAAKERAEKLLAEQRMSEEEYATVAASLERSLSRLNTIKRRRHRAGGPITSEGVLNE